MKIQLKKMIASAMSCIILLSSTVVPVQSAWARADITTILVAVQQRFFLNSIDCSRGAADFKPYNNISSLL